MHVFILFVIASVCVFLIITIIIQYNRYRRIIREKNMGIFQQIKVQNHLAEELERMRIEKEVLMKILNNQLKSVNEL